MKKIISTSLMLFFSLAIIVGLAIFNSSGEKIVDSIATINTKSESSIWTSTYVFIVSERNGNCFYYDGNNSKVTGHTLSEYDGNYSCYEWYLQDEGNNQYSIRFYGNSQYVLSYTVGEDGETLQLCVDQAGSSLLSKQKWILDYSDNASIVGSSVSTRIRNVANGQYIFGRDDGGLHLTNNLSNYPDALKWLVDTSKRTNQNILFPASVKVTFLTAI